MAILSGDEILLNSLSNTDIYESILDELNRINNSENKYSRDDIKKIVLAILYSAGDKALSEILSEIEQKREGKITQLKSNTAHVNDEHINENIIHNLEDIRYITMEDILVIRSILKIKYPVMENYKNKLIKLS
jgi:hypothetical protein